MTYLSQKKPIKQLFDLLSVPNEGSLIIYHRGRLNSTALIASKGGAASLHSERQQKPSVTYLSDREKSFQINPVAQRMCRVAKQLELWTNKLRTIQGSMKIQKKAISKTVFLKCFFECPYETYLASNARAYRGAVYIKRGVFELLWCEGHTSRFRQG